MRFEWLPARGFEFVLPSLVWTRLSKYPRRLGAMQTNGRLILLGVPPEPHSFSAGALLFKRS